MVHEPVRTRIAGLILLSGDRRLRQERFRAPARALPDGEQLVQCVGQQHQSELPAPEFHGQDVGVRADCRTDRHVGDPGQRAADIRRMLAERLARPGIVHDAQDRVGDHREVRLVGSLAIERVRRAVPVDVVDVVEDGLVNEAARLGVGCRVGHRVPVPLVEATVEAVGLAHRRECPRAHLGAVATRDGPEDPWGEQEGPHDGCPLRVGPLHFAPDQVGDVDEHPRAGPAGDRGDQDDLERLVLTGS